jgi:DNA polymerase II
MSEVNGWLFDVYAHPQKGLMVWLAGEDGRPHAFQQDFGVTFYAGGPFARLRELWRFLQPKPVKLERVEDRQDLFDGPQVVMQIQSPSPLTHNRLFREVRERFSDLTYCDVDIPLTVRYAAAFNVFMMGYCRATAEADGGLISLQALDKPDDLDPPLPRLRTLSLRPDSDPDHAPPHYLIARFGKAYLRLPFERPRELLRVLNEVLDTYDPDVIQTHFGDAWLFARLEELSGATGIPFNPNRDPSMPILKRKAVSFFNYGQAHYRSAQVHLRGRWHVDVENCMTYNQYQLSGAIEQTRLSSLPLQEVARRSPGAAIAAMQDLAAVRRGVLVPYQTQKGEIVKTYTQLVRADRGGLIFQPPPGIYKNVAILDFSSMMASIMIKYNVSPETVVALDDKQAGFEIPQLGVKVVPRPGLVPETLRPMRDKRLALKRLLRAMRKEDPHRHKVENRFRLIEDRIKSTVDGIKWLTVVCYGRLGFANSRFGRLNSHEVVSYLSRTEVLRAKAIAEARGFDVLHLYVDSIFISKPGAGVEEFRALAEQIERETGLPMDFNGVIYPWFAFLGTRENPRVGAANKFYGLAPDGEDKIRGIALRRHDTPRFVSNIQLEALKILAKEADPARLAGLLPEVLEMVRRQFALLKNRQVPLENLVVRNKLSREPDQYSVLSPSAAVARQLAVHGKELKRGQEARFIYIGGAGGIFAWDSPAQLDPQRIDMRQYKELTFRAVYEVLQPLGVIEKVLRDWLFSDANYVTRPGVLSSSNPVKLEVPLFSDVQYLRLN